MKRTHADTHARSKNLVAVVSGDGRTESLTNGDFVPPQDVGDDLGRKTGERRGRSLTCLPVRMRRKARERRRRSLPGLPVRVSRSEINERRPLPVPERRRGESGRAGRRHQTAHVRL